MGLLGDDSEWHEALREASMWGSAAQMRQLLVTIVLFCSVCDAASLFNEFYEYFIDDILYNIKKMVQLPTYNVLEDHLKNHVLLELDSLFVKNGDLMTDYGLPEPDRTMRSKVTNRLLAEELAYDCEDLMRIHGTLLGQLNVEQKNVYDVVMQFVYGKSGQCFFCVWMRWHRQDIPLECNYFTPTIREPYRPRCGLIWSCFPITTWRPYCAFPV